MLGGFGDAEEDGFAEMRGKDLNADWQGGGSIEGGGAAGDGDGGDSGEVRGDGEDVCEVILEGILAAGMDFPSGGGGDGGDDGID